MFTSYNLPDKLSFLYIFQMQCLKNTHIQKSKNAGGGCTVLAPDFRFETCYLLTHWLQSYSFPHYSWVTG